MLGIRKWDRDGMKRRPTYVNLKLAAAYGRRTYWDLAFHGPNRGARSIANMRFARIWRSVS